MDWIETRDFPGAAIPFAMDATGNWREVDEVDRGLACGCICPACRGPVVARQGEERIHHFAHHDRRECRLALESSLFGMLAHLLPSVKLAVPGAGDVQRLLPMRAPVYRRQPETRWLVAPTKLDCMTAEVRCRELPQCQAAVAEFFVPGHTIEIHIISLLKRADQVVFEKKPGRHVLGLDLRTYARLWWETCDAEKSERIAEATRAKHLMKAWLEEHLSGRGWFWHGDVDERLRAHVADMERQQRVQRPRTNRVEWPPRSAAPAPVPPAPIPARVTPKAEIPELLDPQWAVPTSLPGALPERWIGTKDGLVRAPLKVMRMVVSPDGAELSERDAANLQLHRHSDHNCWYFVAVGPRNVPVPLRALVQSSPWLPVTAEDERLLRGAQAPD